MEILLPVFYLPPISWFSAFLNPENTVTFETQENFPKQTYRNRAAIYGANGKLPLIIPISHTGARNLSEINISYRENWQKQHWKSLKTAYQSSPYFEYYEDRLETIYAHETAGLLDFNLNALSILQDILKADRTFRLTTEYFREPQQLDLRTAFSAKEMPQGNFPEYFQAFSERYGFLADLSIIDLICNKGPESLTYLTEIKSKL